MKSHAEPGFARGAPRARGGVVGAVLAGGRSQRMQGRDKALLSFGGAPLVARVAERLAGQCDAVIVAAGAAIATGDLPDRNGGLPVAVDSVGGFAGPLAGVLAGLDWIALHAPHMRAIATAPVDGPFLPRDLVARLCAARGGDDDAIACAVSGARRHGVYGLWPVALRSDLRAALAGGLRKVDAFLGMHRVAHAEWPTSPVDPFFNINTPADADAAEDILALFPDA